MKTKLLKKLRKEAKNHFRIQPIWGEPENYYIQEWSDNLYFKTIFNVNNFYKLTLERAINYIEEYRKKYFYKLVTEMINERDMNIRLKKVKDL